MHWRVGRKLLAFRGERAGRRLLYMRAGKKVTGHALALCRGSDL